MIGVIYTILVGTVGLVLTTQYSDRSALARATREDGLVEWLTVLTLLALSGWLVGKLPKLDKASPKPLRPAGFALALLSLLAAGEEISWGQRLFGFQTSDSFQKINYQGETNLHNLMPSELFNGIIIFGFAFVFALFPILWRRFGDPTAWWLPSQELSILALGVILVNHYRVSSLPEKLGLGLLTLILLGMTISAILSKDGRLVVASLVGWLTGGTLYWCRWVLPAANQQYEIRELLVILVVFEYCRQILGYWSDGKQGEPSAQP
jgi:hypothetical protein